MEKFSISFWVLIVLFWYTRACLGCTEEERNSLWKLEPFAYDRNSSEMSDCCEWNGVMCDNARRIVSLDFNNNYESHFVQHFLDASLFLPFTHLQHLDLSINSQLVLQNHQDLRRLNKLKVLILSYNGINNTRIFQSLSTLTSLTVLDLSNNDFNASLFDVGQELCKMKSLQELYLYENQLSGSIPPCFDNLTSLKALGLSKNNLVGFHFPSLLVTSLEYLFLDDNPQFDASTMLTSLAGREFQLRYLDLMGCNINISASYLLKILHNGSKLLVLDFSNNNLHGELPISLFEKNSNLKFLSLRSNSLTGHLHLSVNHFVNLQWFEVSNNHIQGELQPNLGHVFPNLLHLDIRSNNFTGEIPISIHTMKHLELINLSNNNFSGKIPERLDLSCKRLEWIDLSNNRLEGQIPHNIFNLEHLSGFNLSNNQFSGHIPNGNFRLFNLGVFKVNQNRISGEIPSWLCNFTFSLLHLDLSQNQLSGPMPLCLFSQGNLINLSLQQNKLTGTLPKAVDYILSLKVLDVSHNDLSGRIPNWLGYLSNLVVLSLKGNRFSGSIPHELCRLQNIGIMDISHNNLYGPIPICFTNITFGRLGGILDPIIDYPVYWSTFDKVFPDLIVDLLSYVSDSYAEPTTSELENVQFDTKSRINSYKGEIITHMFGIDLSCNNLDGIIPLDIGAITELRGLNLSHNQLTGVIPSSLSNMKQIESLDLSHNKLSGKIPSNLSVLTTLEVFSVAYNNLTGRLPEMVAQFSTFSEASYEGNSFLCGPPLLKQCGGINTDLANTTDTPSRGDDKFGIDRTSFLATFAATYATFLLAFVIVLCINPHWRRRWFYFIDICISFVFPFWSEAVHRRRI